MNFDWRNWTIFGALRLASGALVVTVIVFIFGVLAESNVRHFFEDRGWDTLLTRAWTWMPELLVYRGVWLAIGLIIGTAAMIWLIWAFPHRLGEYGAKKSTSIQMGTAIAVIVIIGGAFYLAVSSLPLKSLSPEEVTKATPPIQKQLDTVTRQRDAALSDTENLRHQLEAARQMQGMPPTASNPSPPVIKYSLTESEIKELADELFQIKSEIVPPADIQRLMLDNPSVALSFQIGRAFDLASIPPTYNWSRPNTPKDSGVRIRVGDIQAIPNGAKKVAQALKKVGIESTFETLTGGGQGRFVIFVGPRP